jgi:hypothetical protein
MMRLDSTAARSGLVEAWNPSTLETSDYELKQNRTLRLGIEFLTGPVNKLKKG